MEEVSVAHVPVCLGSTRFRDDCLHLWEEGLSHQEAMSQKVQAVGRGTCAKVLEVSGSASLQVATMLQQQLQLAAVGRRMSKLKPQALTKEHQ